MRSIIIFILPFCFLFTSCNRIKQSNEYENILNSFFLSNKYNSFLKNNGFKKSDTIYFLENNFINTQHKFTKNISVKSSSFFIKEKKLDFFYIFKIIENEDLSKIIITHKNIKGIVIYLERRNDNWIVSDYVIKKGFKLKETKGTMLYKKIVRDNNINVYSLDK